MNTAAAGNLSGPSSGEFEPGSRAALLDRAACMLKAEGMAPRVEFSYCHAGQETAYFARWEWARDEGAPRLVVFATRTGYLVCQSLQGQPFDVDRAIFGCDVAEDEAAHDELQARQACKVQP